MEAEEKLLTILKEVMEEKLTATNIEVLQTLLFFEFLMVLVFPPQMASVLVGEKYQVYDKAKLEGIIERLRT